MKDQDIVYIAAARNTTALLTITAYCGNPTCPVRETTIDVKDYDRTLVPSLSRQGLTCPVCRRELVLQDVYTATQQAGAINVYTLRELLAQDPDSDGRSA